MPRIWCSISGHGFGHGTQTITILNALGRHIPDLRLLLRTNLPQSFLKDNLTIPWERHHSRQDIGCVQDGPLLIDVPKTWVEYEQFHIDWLEKVRAEAEVIRSHQPDLVISNISNLGIEAGVRAGVPTVAMGSVSWDRVLEYFETPITVGHRRILDQIRHGYQKARFMIRFAPNIPMDAFSNLVDVGPIAGPRLQSTGVVRDLLKMNPEEKLVLVAFGGIRLTSLPFEKLERLGKYRFLVDGSMAVPSNGRMSSINTLPIPFRKILAEADLLVTKPGYATVIEAVRNGLPIVYVRRYNFVDEQILVEYAHRYGRARELHIEQFYKGDWFEALETAQQYSLPAEAPPEFGTEVAAKELAKLL